MHSYLAYEMVAQARFKGRGTALAWLPTAVDVDGATICAGYEDGLLRFLKLRPNEKEDKKKAKNKIRLPYELALFEVCNKAISWPYFCIIVGKFLMRFITLVIQMNRLKSYKRLVVYILRKRDASFFYYFTLVYLL